MINTFNLKYYTNLIELLSIFRFLNIQLYQISAFITWYKVSIYKIYIINITTYCKIILNNINFFLIVLFSSKYVDLTMLIFFLTYIQFALNIQDSDYININIIQGFYLDLNYDLKSKYIIYILWTHSRYSSNNSTF